MSTAHENDTDLRAEVRDLKMQVAIHREILSVLLRERAERDQ